MLWRVIKEVTDEEMGDFRGRSFEAFTFVGLAVGPDVFEKDGREIMEYSLPMISNYLLILVQIYFFEKI